MPHTDPRPTAPLFGFSPWRTGVRDAADLRGLAARADDAGLDVLTVPDHLHLGDKLDAYAALATVLATRPGCAPRSPSPTSRCARPRCSPVPSPRSRRSRENG